MRASRWPRGGCPVAPPWPPLQWDTTLPQADLTTWVTPDVPRAASVLPAVAEDLEQTCCSCSGISTCTAQAWLDARNCCTRMAFAALNPAIENGEIFARVRQQLWIRGVIRALDGNDLRADLRVLVA